MHNPVNTIEFVSLAANQAIVRLSNPTVNGTTAGSWTNAFTGRNIRGVRILRDGAELFHLIVQQILQ